MCRLLQVVKADTLKPLKGRTVELATRGNGVQKLVKVAMVAAAGHTSAAVQLACDGQQYTDAERTVLKGAIEEVPHVFDKLLMVKTKVRGRCEWPGLQGH